MKQTWTLVQAGLTALGGTVGAFLSGFDGLLYALLAFVAIDYATGVMLAIIEKKLSSEAGFKGLFKKVLIFAMVAVGSTIDKNLVGDGQILRTAVIFFYAANEGISILENASKLDVPIPKKLKEILIQLREKSEGDEPGETESEDKNE